MPISAFLIIASLALPATYLLGFVAGSVPGFFGSSRGAEQSPRPRLLSTSTLKRLASERNY